LTTSAWGIAWRIPSALSTMTVLSPFTRRLSSTTAGAGSSAASLPGARRLEHSRIPSTCLLIAPISASSSAALSCPSATNTA
jgi:hypothetical protein